MTQQQREDALLKCVECGSTHFFLNEYRQYMGETY